MSSGSSNIYAPSKSSLGAQDTAFSNLSSQNQQATQGYAPAVSQTAQGLVSNYINNPYASQAQQGSNVASAYGTGYLAPGQAQGAGVLGNLGSTYAGNVGQALATGFSPNNALYQQQLQKTTDQSNAINSMYGLGTSPYGAGLTDQAVQNFNNNWNLNQANLQSLGAQTAGTLGTSATNALTGGNNLGVDAFGTYNQAAGLPSQTYTGNIANDLSALTGGTQAIAGATGINDAQMSQILNYLQYGTSAGQAQSQAQSSALGGLGSLFGTVLGLGTGSGGTVGASLLGFG